MVEQTPAKRLRQIRSFVLREGRLTPGQQKAFERLWPRFGLEYRNQPLNLTDVFGNDNPVFLEIGFGNGDTLATLAQRHPERNFIGIEVHGPGVGRLMPILEQHHCDNVRIYRHDAVAVIRDCIPPNTLHGVYLFFPDPWHKKRHHKRRIVQPDFVALLHRALKPGGFFHAATDWEDYAYHMMRVLQQQPDLFLNQAGPGQFTPRPDERPLTKFEQRGQRLGHGVWDLVFVRNDDKQ